MAKSFNTLRSEMASERRQRNQRHIELIIGQGLLDDPLIEQRLRAKAMGEVQLSLHDLIVEIHELDRKLQALEEKYSLLSVDFYQLYEDGRLRDDELDEIDDLGRWAAWYRMRTRRVAQYDLMIALP